MTITYVVMDENTLAYLNPDSQFAGVLAGKPQLGGHGPMDGPCVISENIRPATLADFEFYRVSPKGHLPEAA